VLSVCWRSAIATGGALSARLEWQRLLHLRLRKLDADVIEMARTRKATCNNGVVSRSVLENRAF
jgi:hypothetical protein